MDDETWITLRAYGRLEHAALRAGMHRRLVEAIRAARQQGASWAEIGRAIRRDPRTVKRWVSQA